MDEGGERNSCIDWGYQKPGHLGCEGSIDIKTGATIIITTIFGGGAIAGGVVLGSELPVAYGVVSSSTLVHPAVREMMDTAKNTKDVIIGAIDNGVVTKTHLLMGENILYGHDEFLEGTERGFSLFWRAEEGVFKVRESGTVSRIGNRLINGKDIKAIERFFGIE